MHLKCPGINFTLWINVDMQVVTAKTPINQFDTANFNNTVTLAGFQAGSFSI